MVEVQDLNVMEIFGNMLIWELPSGMVNQEALVIPLK